MSKVLTFSTVFPSYHPKKGQPTYFVEKLWESIGLPDKEYSFNMPDEYQNFLRADSMEVWAKHHTIRAGNRWSVGDKFSPRVWSGKPYNSKQIIIAPDIEIKKVLDFEIKEDTIFLVNDVEISVYSPYMQQWIGHEAIKTIAKNDGLDSTDLLNWFQFPKPFKGQIVCWSETVEY